MNYSIKNILDAIQDQDLSDAILELKEMDDTGILPDGIVRNMAYRIYNSDLMLYTEALSFLRSTLTEMAALKWVSSLKTTQK